MNFFYFHFLFLELILFLGEVYLLVGLLLYYSVNGLVKFLVSLTLFYVCMTV